MKDKFFIDTNILIYAFISKLEIEKINKSKLLFTNNPFISPQVCFEFINVARKKMRYSFDEYRLILDSIFEVCTVVEENKQVVEMALTLLEKYNLHPFDSKIIATALHHNCSILYSEDMHNGLVIENKLTIINPFLH